MTIAPEGAVGSGEGVGEGVGLAGASEGVGLGGVLDGVGLGDDCIVSTVYRKDLTSLSS
jgi:hypothetical protein